VSKTYYSTFLFIWTELVIKLLTSVWTWWHELFKRTSTSLVSECKFPRTRFFRLQVIWYGEPEDFININYDESLKFIKEQPNQMHAPCISIH